MGTGDLARRPLLVSASPACEGFTSAACWLVSSGVVRLGEDGGPPELGTSLSCGVVSSTGGDPPSGLPTFGDVGFSCDSSEANRSGDPLSLPPSDCKKE
jgi:hypothetical protein